MSLNLLKKQRDSILSTQKITNAVNNIASIRFIKLKSLVSVADYMKDLVNRFDMNLDFDFNTNVLFVFGTDRGLCGNLNFLLLRKFIAFMEKNSSTKFKIYVFGKKIQSSFKYYDKFDIEFCDYKKNIAENVDFIYSLLKNRPATYVIYEKFINVITCVPDICHISYKSNDYDNHSELSVESYFRSYIYSMFFYILIHAQSSEESARMNLMDSATKNINDISRKLFLKMNIIRQGVITNQLIEIISGIESLKKKKI